MSESWNTKYGKRRVKKAPPTIEEALAAAECINDDREQQIEIAAALLGADIDEVRAVAKRIAKSSERRLGRPLVKPLRVTNIPHAVVVEYRAPKRVFRPK